MEIKDWLKDSTELGTDIWKGKYQNGNETLDEWFDRVSGGNQDIKQMIIDKKFLFAGRILANRGLNKEGRKVTYSNCYVIPKVEDSLESIFDTAKYLARTFSYGGGAGIDISKLRPNGAVVHNAARTTSGAVSFMDLYSLTTELIGQKGRRGALMISMDVSHPDIEEFIDIKTDLYKITKANISVKINNEFMKAVEENKKYMCRFTVENTGEVIEKEIDAKNIFMKLCKNNWDYGEPGILYWDRIENWNLMSADENFKYDGVNPCAEEPLPAGGSCLLGSLNLSEFVKNEFTKESYFDFKDFANCVRKAIIGLDEVLDEGLPLHPLQIQRDTVGDLRQIGLGVMGIGECMMKLGVRYGSQESANILSSIGYWLSRASVETSLQLAKENGPFPSCNKEKLIESEYLKTITAGNPDLLEGIRKYGLRHSQLLTTAPTGSLSTMLGITGGIEPIFSFKYSRKTESLHGEDVYYSVTTPIIVKAEESIANGIYDKSILVTAHDLDPKERINMQAIWQQYIDASISSTVNLPKTATVEDVYDVYMEAWKQGCKGVTVFREGCKRMGVLTTDNKEEEREEISIPVTDTSIENCIARGLKIQTGCGSLWVSAYFHKETHQLCHIFLNKGSQGGCNSFMVGLSRLISLCGKKGATLEEIVDQLQSTIKCPSYVCASMTKKGISKGTSCPSAIGHALLQLAKQDGLTTEEKSKKEVINPCPVCGEELSFTNGCNSCPGCGWTKCD